MPRKNDRMVAAIPVLSEIQRGLQSSPSRNCKNSVISPLRKKTMQACVLPNSKINPAAPAPVGAGSLIILLCAVLNVCVKVVTVEYCFGFVGGYIINKAFGGCLFGGVCFVIFDLRNRVNDVAC